MALTKLTTDLIDGSLGTDWQATPKTADFTAVAGEGYFVNTTSAAITVTLPSSPSSGDEVNLVDYAGTADTNNITITSSDNINGSSNDVLIDYERGGVSIVYVDATQGWIAYNAANETATALASDLPPLTVDYLVVAGGGGGAANLGAGGGSSLIYQQNETLSANTSYNITVGAGGAFSVGVGNNGESSIFNISTSGGGGGGGTLRNEYGGDGQKIVNGTTTNFTGGANGGDANASYEWRTGGGGAGTNENGSAGSSTASSNNGTGGDGGNGLIVDILNAANAATASVGEVSGSDVYYGGGGAGGAYTTGGTPGLGGGGIAGVGTTTPHGSDGSPNTGGGGGGAGGKATVTSGDGGSGGSGVVILRYPSGYTISVGSGIIEASGSPFTEGSDEVSVFTGGTGTISFS